VKGDCKDLESPPAVGSVLAYIGAEPGKNVVKQTAEELAGAGDYNGAINTLQSFIRDHPGSPYNPELEFMIAEIREQKGDYLGAYNKYREIVDAVTRGEQTASEYSARALEKVEYFENMGIPLYLSAKESYDRGDYNEAIEYLETFAESHSDSKINYLAYLLLGQAHKAKDDSQQALASLKQSVSLNADETYRAINPSSLRTALGLILELEDASSARSYFQETEESVYHKVTGEGAALCRLYTGESHYKQYAYEDAKAIFNEVISEYPGTDAAALAHTRLDDVESCLALSCPAQDVCERPVHSGAPVCSEPSTWGIGQELQLEFPAQ
jgi:TolA-binding protein